MRKLFYGPKQKEDFRAPLVETLMGPPMAPPSAAREIEIINIAIDPAMMAAHGTTAADVAEALRLVKPAERTLGGLGTLQVKAGHGATVSLSQLAKFTIAREPDHRVQNRPLQSNNTSPFSPEAPAIDRDAKKPDQGPANQ
jgi:hypothetical protein